MWAWDFWAQELTLAALVATIVWWHARGRCPPGLVRAVLLTSPIVLVPMRAAIGTVVSYHHGTAKIESATWGRPTPNPNLDRDFRSFPRGGSCRPEPGALILESVRRATFIALHSVFGPMRGAYIGHYPTPAEASALVAAVGVAVDPDDWSAGELRLSEQRIRITAAWRDTIGADSVRHISAAVAGDCVVFLIDSPNGRFLSLVEPRTFGWFATYAAGPGPSYPRNAP